MIFGINRTNHFNSLSDVFAMLLSAHFWMRKLGRALGWFSILACSGILALLSMPRIAAVKKGDNIQMRKFLVANILDRVLTSLQSLACIFIVPSHYYTYRLSLIIDFIPYSGSGIWKRILI